MGRQNPTDCPQTILIAICPLFLKREWKPPKKRAARKLK
jgi:hypothetical protein